MVPDCVWTEHAGEWVQDSQVFIFNNKIHLPQLTATGPWIKIRRLRFGRGSRVGQRDQTVNLTAQPSEVRILPPPPE